MNGAVNGFSINGTVLPSWVVRAIVVATAVATVASSEPTRTTYATAHGDAAVRVALTQTHTIQARAAGTACASSSSEPTLKCAGSSVATATASGNGALRRAVWATAGGDATCSADALTAQAIGAAQASAIATVDLALAHIIHPGRSVTLCAPSSAASGDVTRYAVAFLTYGYSGSAWGEACVKRSGNNYFERDGYSLATGTATSLVEQDKTKIIATLGAFDYGNSTSGANSFIVYAARATGTATNTPQPLAATRIYRPIANASASASAAAAATRVVMPMATGLGEAIPDGPKARIKYASSGVGATGASVVQALGVRMTMAQQNGATAGATLAIGIVCGMQHWGVAHVGLAGVTTQCKADVAYAATGIAALAMAVTLDSTPTRTQFAYATGVRAVALVGRAYALANSEIRAPDERYMIVQQEDRAMVVPAAERMMVVTA